MFKKIMMMMVLFFFCTVSLSKAEDKPRLIYFGARWCGPCQQFKRNQLVELDRDLVVGSGQESDIIVVDIDDNPELSRRYNVRAVPAFFIIRNGKITRNWVGNRFSARQIKEMMYNNDEGN